MDAISNRHYHSPGRQQVETDPVNISDLANKYVSDKGIRANYATGTAICMI